MFFITWQHLCQVLYRSNYYCFNL